MKDQPTYSVSVIAKLLMISERRVQQLAKRGVIPKVGRGRYPLAGSVQGYVRFLQERSLGDDDVPDVGVERARRLRAQADISELKRDKMRGDLIDIQKVERQAEQTMIHIQSRLLQLPERVSGRLVALEAEHEIKHLLRNEVEEVLNSLADDADDPPPEDFDDEDSTDEDDSTEEEDEE